MSVTDITQARGQAEDVPPVIDKAWRLYVCWARSGRMSPLRDFSDNDEQVAREHAVMASRQKGVRYIAVHTGPSAYPVTLYMEGAELDGDAFEAALLAE